MRTLILLLLAACGPVVASTTHTNEGALCLAEDGTLTLDFGVCLSSSCDSVTSQSCTVINDASGVQIESVLVIASELGDCTADCGIVTMTCGDAPLDASVTEVTYGGETVPLEPCGS